jgi:hypothetical protein
VPARLRRRAGAAAVAAPLLAGLAGCVQQPPPPPAGPQFDGYYIGQSRLTRGGGFICGNPGLPQELTVIGGRFDYPFQDEAGFVIPEPVQVAADGSFRAVIQYARYDTSPWLPWHRYYLTLEGRIVGPTMEVAESDLRCDRISLLQRR